MGIIALYRSMKVAVMGALLAAMALLINVLQVNAIFLLAFHRMLMLKFNAKLGSILWDFMQFIFETNQGRVTTSGDAIPEGENALVISNHGISVLLSYSIRIRYVYYPSSSEESENVAIL